MTGAAAVELVDSPLQAEAAVLDVVIGAGDGFLGSIPTGGRFRIVDLDGNQAVDTLFYDAGDIDNRYSAFDTSVGRRGST